MIKAKTCPVDGQAFEYDTTEAPFQRYCSQKCRREATYQRRQQLIGQERPCAKCRVVKHSSEFASGTHAYCHPCSAQYQRERRPTMPEEIIRWRRNGALRRHGLTQEGFDALLNAQGSRCAICRADDPGQHGWHIDHDHTCCTGRKNNCGVCIRGLLCGRCNIGLGNLRDDPEIFRAAAVYIEQYKSRRAREKER